MADGSILLNLATVVGGKTLQTNTASSKEVQIVGVTFGDLSGAPQYVTTSAGLPVAQQGSWSVGITGTVPLPTGAATQSTLQAILDDCASETTLQQVSTGISAVSSGVGGPGDAAAGTDTSTTGLVGLFKRLLQRITTLLSVLPAALTGSGAFKTGVVDALPAGGNVIGGVTISGTPTVTISGTVAVDSEFPAAAALGDNTANPTVPAVGAFNMVYDGATWDRWTGAVTLAAAIPAGTNLIGDVLTRATASGVGADSYSALSTAAVIAAVIKASPGQVYNVEFFNTSAAPKYVRLYNQTSAPGTGDGANIIWRGTIPGNTVGAGFVVRFPNGKVFSTGIGIRVTAAVADNDNTALGANEVTANVGFK